jgi:hypothetical protein
MLVNFCRLLFWQDQYLLTYDWIVHILFQYITGFKISCHSRPRVSRVLKVMVIPFKCPVLERFGITRCFFLAEYFVASIRSTLFMSSLKSKFDFVSTSRSTIFISFKECT